MYVFTAFEGLVNEVKVHVIQEKRKKPFLGGFRHRLTGVEYHNASIQTVSKQRLPPTVCQLLFSGTFNNITLMITNKQIANAPGDHYFLTRQHRCLLFFLGGTFQPRHADSESEKPISTDHKYNVHPNGKCIAGSTINLSMSGDILDIS